MRLPHDSWDMKLFTLKWKTHLTWLTISKSSWFIEFVIFYAASIFSTLHSFVRSFVRWFVHFLCRYIMFSPSSSSHFRWVSFGNELAHVFKYKIRCSHRRNQLRQPCNGNQVPPNVCTIILTDDNHHHEKITKKNPTFSVAFQWRLWKEKIHFSIR